MLVFYNKRFLKDLAKIPSKQRLKVETFVFTDFVEAEMILKSGKLEKLKGYDQYYKIRIGDYRLGIKFEGDVLSFERVLHRKEIYKLFP